MTATPPPSHNVLRTTWSVVHALVVLAVVLLVLTWWMTDGQGAALASSCWERITDVQQSIAHLLRYPWDDE
jgi:hypothetical protein